MPVKRNVRDIIASLRSVYHMTLQVLLLALGWAVHLYIQRLVGYAVWYVWRIPGLVILISNAWACVTLASEPSLILVIHGLALLF